MANEGATYSHELGDGLMLHAYAIDPDISNDDLASRVRSKDGEADPRLLVDVRKSVVGVDYVDSIDKIKVEVSPALYQVPEQLRLYREAAGADFKGRGWTDNPVSILTTDVLEHPMKIRPGGFFDFKATHLKGVPGKLLPDLYPADKTIAELNEEWGLTNKHFGRYFGFAHIMLANGGDELCFVQRAKGMAIAPDCIGTSGSTPNPPSHDNLHAYWREHLNKEMTDEFDLEPEEFKVRGIYLMDDVNETPFGAVEGITDVSTEELARRIYGKEKAIEEHPIIFGLDTKGLGKLLERFPIFPSTTRIMDMIVQRQK